jgi:ribonucleoside-diphosphate reductase alpha chain
LDYIARWLGGKFISSDYLKLNGATATEVAHAIGMPPQAPTLVRARTAAETVSRSPRDAHEGAPTCSECGMLMVPNGACYKCENCGSTSGCS